MELFEKKINVSCQDGLLVGLLKCQLELIYIKIITATLYKIHDYEKLMIVSGILRDESKVLNKVWRQYMFLASNFPNKTKTKT